MLVKTSLRYIRDLLSISRPILSLLSEGRCFLGKGDVLYEQSLCSKVVEIISLGILR